MAPLILNELRDASKQISFYTIDAVGNYSNVLTIVNGAVGIGSTEPTRAFDVAGDIKFQGNLFKNEVIFVSSQWTSLEGDTTSTLHMPSNVSIGQVDASEILPNLALFVKGSGHVANALSAGTMAIGYASNYVSSEFAMDVDGLMKVTSNVTFAASLSIASNVSVNSDLIVQGNSTLTSLNVTSNAVIESLDTSNMVVSGLATVTSLVVNGGITTSNVNIIGTLSLNGAPLGGLSVLSVFTSNNDGSVTLDSDFSVASNMTVGGLLKSSNLVVGYPSNYVPLALVDINGPLNINGPLLQYGIPYIGSQWTESNFASGNKFMYYSNAVTLGSSNYMEGMVLNVDGPLNFNGVLYQYGVPYIGSQWTSSNTASNTALYYVGGPVAIGTSNVASNVALAVSGMVSIAGSLSVEGPVNVQGSFSNYGQQLVMWARSNYTDAFGSNVPFAYPTDVATAIRIGGDFPRSNVMLDVSGNFNVDGSYSNYGKPLALLGASNFINSFGSNQPYAYVLDQGAWVGIGTDFPHSNVHIVGNVIITGKLIAGEYYNYSNIYNTYKSVLLHNMGTDLTYTMTTNDATRENRVLYTFYLGTGRYYLTGTLPAMDLTGFSALGTQNWGDIGVWSGVPVGYDYTASPIHSSPLYLPGSNEYVTQPFHFFMDVASPGDYTVAVSGKGQRVKFGLANAANSNAMYVVPVRGLGYDDAYTKRVNLALKPVRYTAQMVATTTSWVIDTTDGVYEATEANVELKINGIQYVYVSATKYDFTLAVTYPTMGTTRFTITLFTGITAAIGDIVDIIVWPVVTDATAASVPGYVYQQISQNVETMVYYPSPWMHLHSGGIRTTSSVFVDGDIYVNGNIFSGSNTLTQSGFYPMGGPSTGGTTGMCRNRVINGDMRVNQTGSATFAGSGASANPLDKWNIITNQAGGASGWYAGVNSLTAADAPAELGFKKSLKIQSQSATLTGTPGTDYFLPMQRIEANQIVDFGWIGSEKGSYITVSFWFRALVAGNYPISLVNNNAASTKQSYSTTFDVKAGNAWQYVTIVVPPPPGSGAQWDIDDTSYGMELVIGGADVRTSALAATTTAQGPASAYGWSTVSLAYYTVPAASFLNWTNTLGNWIEFTGVQMEKGTSATPYEFWARTLQLQMCSNLSTGTATATVTATTSSQWTESNVAAAENFLYYANPVTLGSSTYLSNVALNVTGSMQVSSSLTAAAALYASNLVVGYTSSATYVPLALADINGALNVQGAYSNYGQPLVMWARSNYTDALGKSIPFAYPTDTATAVRIGANYPRSNVILDVAGNFNVDGSYSNNGQPLMMIGRSNFINSFGSNQATAFVLDTTAFFGIGTNFPRSNLHVEGDVYISGKIHAGEYYNYSNIYNTYKSVLLHNMGTDLTYTMTTNDATRQNRVLYTFYLGTGRYYLTGTIPAMDTTGFSLLGTQNWGDIGVWSGVPAGYNYTASPIQSSPLYLPGSNEYVTQQFQFFMDVATPGDYTVAVSGKGQRVKFGLANDTNSNAMYVVPIRGLGYDDSYTKRVNLAMKPVRYTSKMTANAASWVIDTTEGTYSATEANVELRINGVQYAYVSATSYDFTLAVTYPTVGTTRFTITLFSGRTTASGDIVDITVWPVVTDATASTVPGYVYQQITQNVDTMVYYPSPWMHVYSGGIRTTSDVFIDGNIYVNGTVYGGSNTTNMTGFYPMGGPSTGGSTGMCKNKIINGDMRINQRVSATFAANGFATYPVDRWLIYTNKTGGAAGWYAGANTASLTTADAPREQGFKTSLKIQSQSATLTTTAGTDYFLPMQRIEANQIVDFGWIGSSKGSYITVSFWFRAKVAGNYNLSLVNNYSAALKQSYNTTFNITKADYWQYVTVPVPPPSGSDAQWDIDDESCGMELVIGGVDVRTTAVAATTTAQGAATTSGWSTVSLAYYNVPAASYTNWTTTVGNWIEFTGVQVEKGTLATPFELRARTMELQMCQRYYYQTWETSTPVSPIGVVWMFTISTTQAVSFGATYPVPLRSVPVFANFNFHNGSGSGIRYGGTNYPITSIDLGTKVALPRLTTSGLTINIGNCYTGYSVNVEM